MEAKPLLFLVVEEHPEVAQNNCDFLKKDEVEQKDINSRIALCMTAFQKKLLLF